MFSTLWKNTMFTYYIFLARIIECTEPTSSTGQFQIKQNSLSRLNFEDHKSLKRKIPQNSVQAYKHTPFLPI